MDSHIKKMEEYLALCRSDDVRTIGIWGFGGIGKTTLANEVFKKIRNQFDASRFVSRVREESTKVNGLVCLQKSLSATLLYCDEDIQNDDLGIQLLRTRLRNKKVLIVLDDVDKLDQIEVLADESWLGPGSRVIITTREKHVLDTCGLLADDIYEVDKLKVGEDFQLFCRKAFKENDAPHDYKDLSKKFVEYAGGIPLALVVLGSYLRGKNITEWSEAFDRLDEDPEKDIMNVLKISFDALKDTVKQIFLHIAFFFNGEDQVRVKRILKSCHLYPESGMRDLVDKALIKINERNELWMHDLLQKMGQHIVHRKFPNEPGKRSRLWINENAYKSSNRCSRSWLEKVLVENTGTTAVESIFLNLEAKEEIQLDADPFAKMCNLRLLKICNVKFSRCPEYFSKELRSLEWHEYPSESLPSSFKSSQLVELKMPNSCITHLWHQSCTKMENLVQLDLSYCKFLIKTPDLSNVPNLKRLILEGCEKLSEVHPTIGDHQHLVVLNMRGCESLESLPHSIGLLQSLQTFILSGCSKLHLGKRKLPLPSILKLRGLTLLNLRPCISQLSKLRELRLFRCSNLQSLPKQLPLSIKFIHIGHCPMLPISKNLTVWTAINGFSFMICGNSDEDEDRTRCQLAVREELHDELFFSKYIEDRIYHEKPFEIRAHFPHSTRVPNWCRHWMSGSSVRAKLPIDTEGSNSRCLGFALFVAFEILENENFQKSWELEKTVCHFSTREGRLEHPIVFQNFEDYRVGSSYGLCCYEPRGGQFARRLNGVSQQFEASVTTNRPDLEVNGCGIHFIWQQDVADFVNNLTSLANHRQHPGFELWSTLESSGAEMVRVYDRSMGTSMNFPL